MPKDPDTLVVGQRVLVANALIERLCACAIGGAAWHLGEVVDTLAAEARYGEDGSHDSPWLVSVPDLGAQLSVGEREIDEGEVQLVVRGVAQIRAAQGALAAKEAEILVDVTRPAWFELRAAFEAMPEVVVAPDGLGDALAAVTKAVRVVLGMDEPHIVEGPGVAELRIALAAMPPHAEHPASAAVEKLLRAAARVVG